MNKDIENLKAIVEDLEDTQDGAIISLNQKEIDSLKSIPKLIEKQQKEIDDLREKYKKLVNSAIDVIFSEDNNDIESLARTLYHQKIIKRDKNNYINPYYHETIY